MLPAKSRFQFGSSKSTSVLQEKLGAFWELLPLDYDSDPLSHVA